MKDSKKLWFKVRRFGWGWTPVSWEGWLVTILYVFVVIITSLLLNPDNAQGLQLVLYFLVITISTIVLLAICFKKGEKPEWRWGGK